MEDFETQSNTSHSTTATEKPAQQEEEKSYQISTSDLDRKFKEFEDMFRQMNIAMGEKLRQAFAGGKKNADQYTHQPKLCSPHEAAKEMVGKKNIVIITGAGLSAASGIPTFRGDNGFWKQSYGGVTDPMEILTYRFFK